MDNTKASDLLGLNKNASEKEIIQAFTKLTRRYPRTHFPEKFDALLDAKNTLLRPEQLLEDKIWSDTFNAQDWHQNVPGTPRTYKPIESLQILLRPALFANIKAWQLPQEMGNNENQMLVNNVRDLAALIDEMEVPF